MSRVYNFSAGPAALPEAVLQQAAEEMLDWQGAGCGVMEMSHRGTFFTRIVENSLRSVPPSVVKVARASGGSRLQIIRTAQLNEAVPSILGGLTINVIAMIEYSALAGTIGAGGIGYVAVTYGYQRFDQGVMLATIVILVVTVAAVQLVGDALVRFTTPHARLRGTVTV